MLHNQSATHGNVESGQCPLLIMHKVHRPASSGLIISASSARPLSQCPTGDAVDAIECDCAFTQCRFVIVWGRSPANLETLKKEFETAGYMMMPALKSHSGHVALNEMAIQIGAALAL